MLLVARGGSGAPFWDATPASRLMEDIRMDCLTYTVTEASTTESTTASKCELPPTRSRGELASER